jgi:hypothetical protein
MNLLNLPEWNIEHVEDSARDYRVHATYGPEPSACIHCGKVPSRHAFLRRQAPHLPPACAGGWMRLYGAHLMSRKKLQGGEAFDKLMGKLAQVPKAEIDRAAAKWKAKRAKKKRKKPDTG